MGMRVDMRVGVRVGVRVGAVDAMAEVKVGVTEGAMMVREAAALEGVALKREGRVVVMKVEGPMAAVVQEVVS